MSAPAEVYARVVRAWKRGGGPILYPVSVCHTERGALRVAGKYPYAEVTDDNGTWTVWAVRNDD